MYKYGKKLRGWIEDECGLMELCERWSFTASLQYLTLQTFICGTQPSTDKCICTHFFVVYQKRFHRWHGIVYSLPGCLLFWWHVEWLVSANGCKAVLTPARKQYSIRKGDREVDEDYVVVWFLCFILVHHWDLGGGKRILSKDIICMLILVRFCLGGFSAVHTHNGNIDSHIGAYTYIHTYFIYDVRQIPL